MRVTANEAKKLLELANTNDDGSDGQGNPGWQSAAMKSLAEKIRRAI